LDKNIRKRNLFLSDFYFNFGELGGALGNYGTLFSIILGVSLVSNMNLGYILLFFGLWYIIVGLYFRLPVPIEPMKVIGVVVIAGGISQSEIVASGIILGILFLILGYCKGMKFIQKKVPQSVIRGIQLSLALILIKTSFNFIILDYFLAIFCLIIIALFLVANKFYKIIDISAIVIILIGIIIGLFHFGIPHMSFISFPEIIIPNLQDFLSGGWLLAIPQAPLTITNAILATSLLMEDLFHQKVDPDEFSKSIGFMNLTSVPFGGFPMCHGAGGLAAQYRFGARSGGSNIICGLILLIIALFFASPEFIELIPLTVFGALLLFVAIELAKHGLKTDSILITSCVAILALLINVTIAFIIGLILAYLIIKMNKISK